VLSEIITRIRDQDGTVPLVTAYDYHERVWNPPMPLLFQRHHGGEHHAVGGPAIRELISDALTSTGITDASGKPLRFVPHDFRRIFITDAIMHGMPPHIAQLIAGHRDIGVTLGYKAVYPEEVINAHRAFITRRRALRPAEEYRTPTEEEWAEFLGHFERRKLSLGTCGRSYDTGCIHEHDPLTEPTEDASGLRPRSTDSDVAACPRPFWPCRLLRVGAWIWCYHVSPKYGARGGMDARAQHDDPGRRGACGGPEWPGGGDRRPAGAVPAC
jgi:Phage integrase family